MTRIIPFGNRMIGEGEPVYIILEAGSNWLDLNHAHDPEYGFKQAKELIDSAKEVGADAIKFQIFRAKDHFSKEAPLPKFLKDQKKKNLFKLIQELELPRTWVQELEAYAREIGIDFLTSPCDREAVELLMSETNPCGFKVASFDIVDLDFLRYMGSKQKPIILSTGMATEEEIQDSIHAITETGNSQICLLHCVSSYPTPPEQASLRSITALHELYSYPIGFSDHTLETWTPSIAVALGASVIEKHFTLDRKQAGPDHPFALEPLQAEDMIQRIRTTENMLGEKKIGMSECEAQLYEVGRRSLVLAPGGIQEGNEFEKKHFVFKRGDGILPRELPKVLGKKAKRSFQSDEVLHWSDL